MKIGIDARMITWSGIGRYSANLIAGLHEYAPNDLDITLYLRECDRSQISELEDFKYRFVDYPVFYPQSTYKLNRIVSKDRIDIFHSPHFVIPLGEKNFKIIATIHDLIPLIITETMNNTAKRAYYGLFNRHAARKADCLIVPSDHTARDVMNILEVPEDKIRVIHCALDKVFISSNSDALSLEQLQERFNIDKPYFFALGNQKPNKGLEYLVDAFAQAITEGKLHNIDIILTGLPDKNFNKVAQGIKRHGLEDRIHFIGFVNDQELKALYANSTAFIFPSLYEGFGLPPLEAMALNAPVIGARRASLPEILDDAALLIDPANRIEFIDALEKISYDHRLRTDLVQRGQKNLERFKLEDFTDAVIKTYAQI